MDGVLIIHLHHGGAFVHNPTLKYVGGDVDINSNIDSDFLSIPSFAKLLQALKYSQNYQALWYRIPDLTFDDGLRELSSNSHVLDMVKVCLPQGYVNIYVDDGIGEENEFHLPLVQVNCGYVDIVGSDYNDLQYLNDEQPSNPFKLSRKRRLMSCTRCNQFGHNRRGCRGQAAPQPKRDKLPVKGRGRGRGIGINDDVHTISMDMGSSSSNTVGGRARGRGRARVGARGRGRARGSPASSGQPIPTSQPTHPIQLNQPTHATQPTEIIPTQMWSQSSRLWSQPTQMWSKPTHATEPTEVLSQPLHLTMPPNPSHLTVPKRLNHAVDASLIPKNVNSLRYSLFNWQGNPCVMPHKLQETSRNYAKGKGKGSHSDGGQEERGAKFGGVMTKRKGHSGWMK